MLPKQTLAALLILAVIAAAALIYVFVVLPSQHGIHGTLGDIHTHADFKVYINGVALNFSQAKYMSNDTHVLSPFVHMHNMDGGVIHQHIAGVTLGDFFKSLKMSFNSTCFALDNGSSYCDDGTNTLKMYVEHYGGQWQKESAMDSYEFQDMDKILITYGPETEQQLGLQYSSLTDRACMYSLKCPEKGTLNVNESECVGGSGTGCTAVQ
jgi:hypothetical protein